MTDLSFTRTLTANTPENIDDVQTMLNEVKAHINGANITNANLTGAAEITDVNLASPNNSTYKALTSVIGMHVSTAALAAGTYWITRGAGTLTASGSGVAASGAGGVFHLTASRFAVTGKTTKLYVDATVLTNPTAPAMTHTVGLYPVTFSAAGNNQITPTLGTVVSGSTAAIASPSASAATNAASGDFTLPSDGAYILGVTTSGTLASNAAVQIVANLSVRNV